MPDVWGTILIKARNQNWLTNTLTPQSGGTHYAHSSEGNEYDTPGAGDDQGGEKNK